MSGGQRKELPMTTPRANPYVYVTWVPRYLVGDKVCAWACWYKANNRSYEKAQSDFDLAKWQMEHTDLMNKLVDELEQQGCEVFIEHQNSFKAVSSHSGMVISGKPDLVARFPDGRTVIYDAKTGQESPAHVLQVMIYMYLLPRSQDGRWRDTTFEGAVVYRNGNRVDIPAASVNQEFVARLAEFIRKMTSKKPARRVPSEQECRFCDLTRADCPVRIEPDADAA